MMMIFSALLSVLFTTFENATTIPLASISVKGGSDGFVIPSIAKLPTMSFLIDIVGLKRGQVVQLALKSTLFH